MAMKEDQDKPNSKKFKLEEINGVVEAMKNHQIIGRWIRDWGLR
jgi:D-arabinose 1-dehydrogenase-like Zn-dependent alcohol dehydrogenase